MGLLNLGFHQIIINTTDFRKLGEWSPSVLSEGVMLKTLE